MAKFRFKLESLLRHRRAVEDAAQLELAKALRGRMILENQVRQMQQTITHSKRELRDGLVGKVDLDAISGFARFSGQCALRARELVGRLSQLHADCQRRREELAAAVRARKAVELLRERQLEAFRREQMRKEAIELDEAATQRFVRERLLTETLA